MNSTEICKLCGEPIHATQGIISCNGFCLGSYHRTCVGLDIEAIIVWNRHSSIWWMCEACGKMMQNLRDDESMLSKLAYSVPAVDSVIKGSRETRKYVDEQIAELKKEVTSIHQALVELNSSRDVVVHPAPIAHSSPHQPMRIKRGSRPVAGRTTLNASSEKCQLFLTKIKNSATENDILEMVVRALGIENSDDVDVKKLIPFWKDVTTVPYVSFKVVLDLRFKHAAERTTTWPEGLCFREFVDVHSLWDPQSSVV